MGVLCPGQAQFGEKWGPTFGLPTSGWITPHNSSSWIPTPSKLSEVFRLPLLRISTFPFLEIIEQFLLHMTTCAPLGSAPTLPWTTRPKLGPSHDINQLEDVRVRIRVQLEFLCLAIGIITILDLSPMGVGGQWTRGCWNCSSAQPR